MITIKSTYTVNLRPKCLDSALEATEQWRRCKEAEEKLNNQQNMINDLAIDYDKEKKDVDKLKGAMKRMSDRHKMDKDELEQSLRKSNNDRDNLQERLSLKNKEVIDLKRIAREENATWKADKQQIGILTTRNRELNRKMDVLQRAAAALGSSVADTQEPGPQKGEEKPKQSVEETSWSEANNTTGGIIGDSDGDTESLNNTLSKPSKGVRKKEPPKEDRDDRSTDRSQDSSYSESKERRRKGRDRREWEEERKKDDKEMKKAKKELDQLKKEKARIQENLTMPPPSDTPTQGR